MKNFEIKIKILSSESDYRTRRIYAEDFKKAQIKARRIYSAEYKKNKIIY